MTKFKTLQQSKPKNKTTFDTLLVGKSGNIKRARNNPTDFDNVLHIGCDNIYGDVFKAWSDNSEDGFFIYFGKKGDEFD